MAIDQCTLVFTRLYAALRNAQFELRLSLGSRSRPHTCTSDGVGVDAHGVVAMTVAPEASAPVAIAVVRGRRWVQRCMRGGELCRGACGS